MKKLTITKERFLEWYFDYGQDQENEEVRIDLANSIIDQMFKVGFGSMSVNELFDNCNQETIRAYYTEQYDMQTDEFDIELSDLGFEYEIILLEDNLKSKPKTPSKEEIIEYMNLHNSDEVGIDNQWTYEDAEYHLLLSDKYHNK